jgi:hypothetical protein
VDGDPEITSMGAPPHHIIYKNPLNSLNMEKTIIHYKRFKLAIMLNAFIVGVAYDNKEVFMAFGLFIIEIDFKKKNKRNTF